MTAIVLSMLVFAMIGAITPGPVNIIATGAGANFGFNRTLPFVLGTTISYTLVVFLVGIGLNAILLAFPPDYTKLTVYWRGISTVYVL